MSLDKELPKIPTTVKCKTMQLAQEGGKMGWSVPQTTMDFFTDIRKPFIRSSPLAVLDHCPRKFLYESRLGIIPRRYESALTMGTIVHKVLQSLFMGKTKEEALSVCERLLATEQQRLIDDAGPDGFLPTGVPLDTTLKKLEEDYHKARATGLVFWQFVPFNRNKWEVLRTPEGTPMVELLLECEYPGLSRPFRTPCDLVLIDKGTGEIWIVDFKTTGFDPKKRAVPTKISAQLAVYRLSLQSHLDSWHEEGLAPKRTVVGSLHAIIKKSGIKFCGKDADFAAYVQRLIQWYKDADTKDPENPPMILEPNRFTGPLMSRELWGRLKQYCKACQAAPNVDAFYRSGESACLTFNRICPYMGLCNSDPAMWPDIIRERFEISFREDREEKEDG
ncbi:hypothetical protein LCGC14_0549150 [marine sediment metagenome]|uniref:PD-(D/E)XK endonuclease-like domain-containing protein n=1 Tax=marine sediment metagenome TaxID=412755 RepID=A0A0F9S8X8_9ZZZZ